MSKLRGTVVFSSGRTADFDIWSLEVSSGELTQLTSGDDLNDFPRFSPDGQKIAYISSGADLIPSLWVMNRDGTEKTRLTTDVYSQDPNWAPDGESLVFTCNHDNNDEIEICRFTIATGKREVLLQRKGHETEPCLSPDGKKLLFSSTDPDSTSAFNHRDTGIWEYDLENKKERLLCNHPARDFGPVYSPDGRRVAFISTRNNLNEDEYQSRLNDIQAQIQIGDRKSIDEGLMRLKALEQDTEIHVMDLDGSNQRQLTSNSDTDIGVRWSPCGQFLIYASTGRSGERLQVIEVESGQPVDLAYDRKVLMAEISADPGRFLNKNFLSWILPDFIDRPFKQWYVGSFFWGSERRPDWTYA